MNEQQLTLAMMPIVVAIWAFYFMVRWPKRQTLIAVVLTVVVAVFVIGHYLGYY